MKRKRHKNTVKQLKSNEKEEKSTRKKTKITDNQKKEWRRKNVAEANVLYQREQPPKTCEAHVQGTSGTTDFIY